MPLVLLVDPGVVSEGEHSEPPSQKRKSDNGNAYLVIFIMLYTCMIMFKFQSVHVHPSKADC